MPTTIVLYDRVETVREVRNHVTEQNGTAPGLKACVDLVDKMMAGNPSLTMQYNGSTRITEPLFDAIITTSEKEFESDATKVFRAFVTTLEEHAERCFGTPISRYCSFATDVIRELDSGDGIKIESSLRDRLADIRFGPE